jgi:hypothetical protein
MQKRKTIYAFIVCSLCAIVTGYLLLVLWPVVVKAFPDMRESFIGRFRWWNGYHEWILIVCCICGLPVGCLLGYYLLRRCKAEPWITTHGRLLVTFVLVVVFEFVRCSMLGGPGLNIGALWDFPMSFVELTPLYLSVDVAAVFLLCLYAINNIRPQRNQKKMR